MDESVYYVIFNDRLEQREIVKVHLYDFSFHPPPAPRIYLQIKAAYFISGLWRVKLFNSVEVPLKRRGLTVVYVQDQLLYWIVLTLVNTGKFTA